jgi:hypothetical protein
MMRRRWLQWAAAWSAALTGQRAAATSAAADHPEVTIPPALLRHRVSASRDLRAWRHAGLDLSYLDTGGADLPVLVCLHAIGHGSGDFEAMAVCHEGLHHPRSMPAAVRDARREAGTAPGFDWRRIGIVVVIVVIGARRSFCGRGRWQARHGGRGPGAMDKPGVV